MMRDGVALTALAAALATVSPSAWAQQPGAAAARTATAPSLTRLLAAPRLDPPGVDALYRQAVLQGGVAALEAEVAAAARRADAAPAQRARASLIGALLAWQDGRIDAAATAAEAALAIDPNYDAQLLRARLFDATGRPAQAVPFYTAAARTASNAQDRAALQLRAAIAAADDDPQAVRPLITAAEPRERRGIAVLLGLSGDPAGALETYRPAVAGAPPFSARIRMAQWAIAAKDRAAATDAAWAASRAGATPADRRYALALLAEAFRDARDLTGLLAFLNDKPAGPDVTQLRIDTLVELGRLDEALALLRAGTDPALRAQLPGLLDLAGRREALIAEYERRIAGDPAALRWVDGLAVLLLSTGDRAGAVGVFRRMFAANPGNSALRTDAARRMIAMGLTDEGLALLGDGPAGRSTAIRLFRFESEAVQGRTEAAAATLSDLDRSLPPRDPQRMALADGYERLGRGSDALRILLALERAGHAFGFDDQLHVVRLQRAAGDDAAALTRLLDLWFVTTLPAQRGFVEAQIVEVARRIDRIDALSDEVRARIAGDDDRGVELFVALRVARNDASGAGAAVAAFAQTAAGSPARLQRAVALYRRLNDHARYRATLARLVAADPANTATYLQQLVRDVATPVRGADTVSPPAELDALLARLSAARRSDPAEARRFAADVYGGAGDVERAVRLYREAAALSATDREAVLGLVNLLNANGARGQAVAMLQYRAEFAATPADQAHALDALAGVLAATSRSGEAEQSPQYAAVRLAWARRRLTWRLARGDDDAGLYDQLSDLSEQIGDTRMQRRVREASLAVEGTQRAATLRQLIALSSTGAAAGNDDATARYGRRLTALRQAYPADVYAELAAAMLKQRDPAGAERAFALIEDIPGLVNVDALRADAYLASGYLSRALAGYSRALLRDRGDAGLILKTAILQEQIGDRDVARALYWQSLRDTLQRLPAAAAAGPAPASSPFDDSLLEGLLFTWPGDPAQREVLRDAMTEMTRQATEGATTWSGAARARRLLTIARQLAASGRDPAVLAAIDPLIAARFAGDADLARDRAAFRDMTGQPVAMAAAAPVPSDGDWATAALTAQAQGGTNPELRLALALDRGDDGELTTLFEQAARAEVAKRNSLGPTDFVYESPLNAMLTMVAGQLPAARLRAVVLAPLDTAGNRETALFDLYRTAPDRLAAMERMAGGPLLSAERLATLIRTRFNDPLPRRTSLRRRTTPPKDIYAAMIARFSLDQQVALYAALAEDGQRTGAEPVLVAPLERHVLRQTLSAGQQARMTDAIGRVMGLDLPVAQRAGRLFALADVPTANRPIVVAGARALADRSPQDRVVADTIEALFRGDRAAALEVLLAAAETPGGGEYAPGAIADLLAEDYRRQGAAFVSLPNPDAASRARFYRRYVQVNPTGFGGTDADARTYLERLASLEPDNGVYLAQLLDRLWRDGDRTAVLERLAPFVAAHPDDRDAAALLQMTQRLAGQDAAAVAVAARSRIDVDDPDTLADLVARMQAARDNASAGNDAPAPTFLMLFGYAYDTARQERPTLRGIAAVAARNRTDAGTIVVSADLLDPVVRAAADPANLGPTMRGVWRRSAADPDRPEDPAQAKRGLLLERLTELGMSVVPPGTRDGNTFAAALTATPAIVAELEEEVRLIDPVVRRQQQPLYDLIAAGAVRQRTAGRRIDDLLATLADASIDAHGLQLLATLAARDGRVLDAAQVAGLRRAVERMPTMGARERILWSQVLARSGNAVAARQWLEAAVLQILYVDRADLAGGPRLATFDTIVQSLGTWSDRAAAVAAHAALSARVDRERAIMPPDDVPGPLPPLTPAS